MTKRTEVMRPRSWELTADLEPIVHITRLVGADGPLAYHSMGFIRIRRQRIERVSKMTLNEQNAYYRSLGFFK